MRDTIILGGGPAGAATAIALARGGARPLLIERAARPTEKVCGEFLAADAATLLGSLGVDLARLGAVQIRRCILGAGRQRAEFDLPFTAWGLPRAKLDGALLACARVAGAEICMGRPASLAEREDGAWRVRVADGAVARAQHLVLATGKHEMRGLPRGRRGGSIGVKLPLLDDPVGDAIALLGCAGGYAGLQPRPGGGANLCAALDPGIPGVAAAARDPRAFLDHVMAGSALATRLLRRSRPALVRPLTVAGVPYGFLYRGGEAGPFRVGDQAAVIPSFCGDGVAMALGSGLGAANAILTGRPPEAYHEAWRRAVRRPMRLAGMADRLIDLAPGMLVFGATILPGLVSWAAQRLRAV